MIRTNAEYEGALNKLDQDRKFLAVQREKLRELGLNEAEVDRGMEPALAFHEQLKEEVEAYERMRRGDIAPIEALTDIGRILIGLRIATQTSQKDLAERLGVSESQVSRDERNDYHGITVERAERIIRALGGRIRLVTEVPDEDMSLAVA